MIRHGIFFGAVGAIFCACSPGGQDEATAAASSVPPVVDSVESNVVALERFRADVAPPAQLRDVAATRDELVHQLVDVLARNDTMGIEPLAVNRAEWAYLYYPDSPISRPPYELPPGVAWFQLQGNNRTGALRLLREFGGREPALHGYTCPAEPVIEGLNRLWTRCLVEISRAGEAPAAVRLFSSILERDGRFLFLSLANDF